MARLNDKVALVTGAACGIGEAIATAFAREGAHVVVTDLDEPKGRARARHIGATWQRLDLRDEMAWIGVVARVLDSHGRLDVLVNNARISGLERLPGGGVIRPHSPEHASLEVWHAAHRTNLNGVFLGCKHAIRSMRRQGAGCIVNISPRSGPVDGAAAAVCASSRAAVLKDTRTVALCCAEQRLAIRCNAVHPPALLTPLWEPEQGGGTQRAERWAALCAGMSLSPFGTPEDVAVLAVLLASDDSSRVTGSGFPVGGGWLAASAMLIKEARMGQR